MRKINKKLEADQNWKQNSKGILEDPWSNQEKRLLRPDSANMYSLTKNIKYIHREKLRNNFPLTRTK